MSSQNTRDQFLKQLEAIIEGIMQSLQKVNISNSILKKVLFNNLLFRLKIKKLIKNQSVMLLMIDSLIWSIKSVSIIKQLKIFKM